MAIIEVAIVHSAAILVQVLKLGILVDLLIFLQNYIRNYIAGYALSTRKHGTNVDFLFLTVAILSAELSSLHPDLFKVDRQWLPVAWSQRRRQLSQLRKLVVILLSPIFNLLFVIISS